MKKIRIIPRLDIKGANVVKGIHCEGLRVVGNPKSLITQYHREGADEILCMDIVASLYQRNFDFDLLKSISEGIFIPITVGGGIRSINDINQALRSGADKVAINTYAISHPDFLSQAAQKFGSQCIVLSMEAKRVGSNRWEVYTDGGREKTGVDAVQWARKAIQLGVGEIIVTSVDRDGTRKGYDFELTRAIASFSPIPVIAHGGAGTFESFKEILKTTRLDALAAGSVFHYGNISIASLKKYLHQNKIAVRT